MKASRVQWLMWMGLAMLAVVFVALSAKPGGSAMAQSPGPQLGASCLSADKSSSIVITDVVDLYSADLRVPFNKGVLQVKEIVIPTDSVFAAPATVAPFDIAKFNTDGVIRFIATRENTQTVFSGTRVLFTVQWNVTGAGTCISGAPLITISPHVEPGLPTTPPQLSTRDGMDIPYTAVSCTTCPPDGGPCAISGTVKLQGRTAYTDTDIFLSTERTCPTNFQFTALWGWPGMVMTKTGPDGSFSITSGDKQCQCLYAARHGYLSALGKPPYPYTGTIAMQNITLLGGDATQDDAINVFDLALIANRYGGADPVGDINGDGKVDIYDLALAAGNSGVARGPQQWSR